MASCTFPPKIPSLMWLFRSSSGSATAVWTCATIGWIFEGSQLLLDRRDCRALGQNRRLRHKPKAFKPKAYPLENRAHMQNMRNSSANATQNSPAKELDFK